MKLAPFLSSTTLLQHKTRTTAIVRVVADRRGLGLWRDCQRNHDAQNLSSGERRNRRGRIQVRHGQVFSFAAHPHERHHPSQRRAGASENPGGLLSARSEAVFIVVRETISVIVVIVRFLIVSTVQCQRSTFARVRGSTCRAESGSFCRRQRSTLKSTWPGKSSPSNTVWSSRASAMVVVHEVVSRDALLFCSTCRVQ